MGEHDKEGKPREPLLPHYEPPRNPETPRQRIGPFPAGPIDLGMQLVGSSQVFELVRPHVTSKTDKTATAVVSIAPATIAMSRRDKRDEVADRLSEGHRMKAFSPIATSHEVRDGAPIEARFMPQFSGHHEADINIMLRWADDAVDLRTIRARGDARALEDAPLDGPAFSDEGEYKELEKVPRASIKKVDPDVVKELDDAAGQARLDAGNLALMQRDGVGVAERQALSYQRKPPPSSPWDFLAELALTMGVGGIASLAGKAAGLALGPKLAAAKVPSLGSPDAGKYTEAMVTDIVKDGLKNAAKAATVRGALRGSGAAPDSGEYSSNATIEFFARQRNAAIQLKIANEAFVTHHEYRLRHLLQTSPHHAVAVMTAISEGLAAQHAAATQIQRDQSEILWVGIRSRGENGEDHTKVDGVVRPVSQLLRATGQTRGVLQIAVGADGQVKSASMWGISQEVANDVARMRLRSLPIPVVIQVGDSPYVAIYTRDEAGRVRQPYAERDVEIAHHAEAQKLVDRILSKSMLDWGIKIKTDDATGVDS